MLVLPRYLSSHQPRTLWTLPNDTERLTWLASLRQFFARACMHALHTSDSASAFDDEQALAYWLVLFRAVLCAGFSVVWKLIRVFCMFAFFFFGTAPLPDNRPYGLSARLSDCLTVAGERYATGRGRG